MLLDYFRVIARWWPILVGALIVGSVAGTILSAVTPPTFVANTTVVVSVQPDNDSVRALERARTTSQLLADQLLSISTSSAFAMRLNAQIADGTTSDFVVIPDLVRSALVLSASGRGRDQQVDCLEIAVAELERELTDRTRPASGDASAATLDVIAPPVSDPEPSSPRWNVNIALGALAAGGLAFLGLFAYAFFGRRVVGDADVLATTGAPLLARICIRGPEVQAVRTAALSGLGMTPSWRTVPPLDADAAAESARTLGWREAPTGAAGVVLIVPTGISKAGLGRAAADEPGKVIGVVLVGS